MEETNESNETLDKILADNASYYRILGKRMLEKFTFVIDFCVFLALGVAEDASLEEINRAYRQLSRRFHPDKYRGDRPVDAMKAFQLLANAVETLRDPNQRHQYDLNHQNTNIPNFSSSTQNNHPFESTSSHEFGQPHYSQYFSSEQRVAYSFYIFLTQLRHDIIHPTEGEVENLSNEEFVQLALATFIASSEGIIFLLREYPLAALALGAVAGSYFLFTTEETRRSHLEAIQWNHLDNDWKLKLIDILVEYYRYKFSNQSTTADR
jgi:hypothetical protein